MAFLAFDVLELGRRSLMREPWRAPRGRLETLFDGGAFSSGSWCR